MAADAHPRDRATPALDIASRFVRVALLSAGFAAIVVTGLRALGGAERLWQFTRTDQHRFTAMAMLTGTLRLRAGLALLGFDEQVFNGAVYTNWGYGVPLLQLPFQAAAVHLLPRRFFPDRAICFFYFLAVSALLWAAFARLLASRSGGAHRVTRGVVSWAATALVLGATLYPLMACRFIVYEETICYFVLCELAATGFYVLALGGWATWAASGMAAAAGVGLLVRPTGLIYLAAWGLLAIAGAPKARARLAFAAAVAPFVAFWMYSNWVKTGAPLALGLQNTVVPGAAETAALRFGSACVDSPAHLARVTAALLEALFVLVPDGQRWMSSCNFQFEERPPAAHEPFLGIAVLALLAWILLSHLIRRRRRFAAYVPFGGIALLLGCYAYAGAGLAWRYVGDFSPFVVLACVEYARTLPASAPAGRACGLPLAAVLAIAAFGCYRRSLDPWQPGGYYGDHWETLPAAAVDTLWDDFTRSRYTLDGPLPPRIDCGKAPDWPPGNGVGWRADCDVDVVTNVYLGVPAKPRDAAYEVRVRTRDVAARSLKVYVNGRVYTAQRAGDEFVASVWIPYERLHAAIVLATIEWARTGSPAGKLLSIELA